MIRHLGEGGMGNVFEAEHVRTRRHVALKKIVARDSSNPEVRDRFEREALLMSRLDHPHISAALDFGTAAQPDPYIVLELLQGETLEERLRARAPLPLEEAVEIASQIAAALAAAHLVGVVHCDVKPSNVFLTEAAGALPFVKLLDFGISKDLCAPRAAAQSTAILGTPEYMAPEQITGRDEDVDERTDQWALGLLVYEMLTGERPFAGNTVTDTLVRVSTVDVPAASSRIYGIPPAVDGVLRRALSRLPTRRYCNIGEFSHELETAALSNVERRPNAPPTMAPTSGVRLKTMRSLAPLSVDDRPTAQAIAAAPASRALYAGTVPKQVAERNGTAADSSADSDSSPDPLRRILHSMRRARVATERGEIVEAAAHAEAAMRQADECQDPYAVELVHLSASLFSAIRAFHGSQFDEGANDHESH